MKKIFYAQSGGTTAVINVTACAVIETARKFGVPVYAGKNGIIGLLNNELIDTSQESVTAIELLKYTPGAAFGSCRYKLDYAEQQANHYPLIKTLAAHKIEYFLYNGGGDSQDTLQKIAQMSNATGYPLRCIGLPKTIDNDLVGTDVCPGFGSVAKYIATAVGEVGLDLAAMAPTSTKVFILEVMGRHTGWIAAAAGLASTRAELAPHIIIFPEIPFAETQFLQQVQNVVQQYGSCMIVVAEGARMQTGKLLSLHQINYQQQLVDAPISTTAEIDQFGHFRLGGVAPLLAQLVKVKLNYKCHWAVANYLQRAARHLASATDVSQAYAVGQAGVELALAGHSNIMVTINRIQQQPYQWEIGTIALAEVANFEKKLPRTYISEDGMHISTAARNYLLPLIIGETNPPFLNGLPHYSQLKQHIVSLH